MALSLLCGGLGVAEAAVVHVNEVAGGTSAVYTTDETYTKTEADAKLDLKANAADVNTELAKKADAANVYTKNEADAKLDLKADAADVNTELAKKADTANVYTKNEADAKLDLKANAADVNTELAKKADKATTLAGYGITDAYTKADVDNAVAGAVTTAGTNVDAKLADYAKTADVDTKLAGKADKATTLAGYGITDAYTKGEVAAKLNTKANQTDLTQATDRITANEAAITGLTTKTTEISYAAGDGTKISGVTIKDGNIVGNGNSAITGLTNVQTNNINGKSLAGTTVATEKDVADAVKAETDARTKADNALSGRIDANANEIARVNQELVNTNNHFNTELGKTNTALQAEGQARAEADAKINKKIGNIDDTRTAYVKDANSISQNLTTLDEKLQDTNDRTGGIARNTEKTQTTIEGIVKVDNQGNVKDVNELSAKKITTTEDAVIGGKLGVTGETTLNGTLAAKGEAKFEKNVTAEKDLTVKGTLNTKDVTAETIHISKLEENADYKSEGKIIGEGGNLSVSNEKTDKRTNITETSELNVNEKGTVSWATSKDNATGNVTEGRSEVTADKIKNSVKKTEGGTTFGYEENITADGKVGTATDKDGNRNELTQTATGTENTVTSKDGNKSTTKQEAGSISSTVYDKDGNVKASSEMKDDGSISNKATGDMTNDVGGNQTTTVTGDISNTAKNITNAADETLTDRVGTNTRVTTSTSITDTVGATTNRKIEDGKITDTAGDSTVTTENGKGTTFAKTDSAEYSTEAGAPKDTNIAGNLITTGRVDANELGVSDKDGANTADLSVKAGEGVKASAGNGTTTGSLDVKADEVVSSVKDADGKGSTFKQRIDAIMMESKDVSIKAEETLTNEAKVITNKASEVINNEAININNTAKGIITSKASEIKNQADKLISNKVGENTWENMENGKITTSIKDGAKQNLTQSDAAGTTQSTVDGGKSTVTIQNADGLTDAVTDGRNTSVQNQTASQIVAAVKDGAGNVNASVANATTSANTITNGTKTNTVISTVDGTSFINSEANTAFEGGTYTDTTIKGNTITTGKVTMDYADVMKDLGVHGSATVDHDLTVKGITTTKTLKVTENATVGGTLDVTKKATFHDDVDIAKNLSVGEAVTAKSYKVGGNTYIDANGINANNQKITNVADGSISEGSKDAVNGGQLYGVKRDLEHQVDKVGANAAAMANLRPMEFDPSSKWNIAAAIGNYGSETAAAIGAFYRPNDNVMVNLSTAFGTGENMVGGGVSVRLGKGGNKLSREETNALKAQVADLTARMDALLSVLNPNMSKDFPDVPENHWAYEAVSRLAGNDIVQGYPDGEFHGERTMTRYEMAEIIYNALSRGAEAERKLVEEFKPELQAMAASEKATAEKAEG